MVISGCFFVARMTEFCGKCWLYSTRVCNGTPQFADTGMVYASKELLYEKKICQHLVCTHLSASALGSSLLSWIPLRTNALKFSHVDVISRTCGLDLAVESAGLNPNYKAKYLHTMKVFGDWTRVGVVQLPLSGHDWVMQMHEVVIS